MSMLKRGDTALRSSHANGLLLTYRIPEITIPDELLEIVLWNNPIEDDAVDQAS